jgi:hypothetical protein
MTHLGLSQHSWISREVNFPQQVILLQKSLHEVGDDGVVQQHPLLRPKRALDTRPEDTESLPFEDWPESLGVVSAILKRRQTRNLAGPDDVAECLRVEKTSHLFALPIALLLVDLVLLRVDRALLSVLEEVPLLLALKVL